MTTSDVPPSTVTFPVEYSLAGDARRNAQLQESGTLIVETAGPHFVFTGKPRARFTAGTSEARFSAGAITNVVVDGRAIIFTPRGQKKSADEPEPFVFFARDAATAQTIADLLPQERDTTFVEQNEFHTRLNAVAPERPAWAQVTPIIIALNVAAFVVMAAVFDAGWFEVNDIMAYVRYGANNGAATTDGQWWRLVTSMFLHYGIIHLALNMWALFAAGQLVERLLGRGLFALTYLGAGLAGGFASILWHGDRTWSAGASGAVFGVFGALLGFALRQKQAVPKSIFRGLMKSTLTFAGYNILFGLARSGIDNAAHVGGLLGGLAFGWLVARPLEAEARQRLAFSRISLGLVTLAALVGIGVFATPRFDYSFADELAFEASLEATGNRETELVQHHNQAVAQLTTVAARTEHIAWMEEELLPFYRDFLARISALPLDEERDTDRRRDILVQFCEQRLGTYTRLLEGLRRNDPAAAAQFFQEDKAVVALLGTLRK